MVSGMCKPNSVYSPDVSLHIADPIRSSWTPLITLIFFGEGSISRVRWSCCRRCSACCFYTQENDPPHLCGRVRQRGPLNIRGDAGSECHSTPWALDGRECHSTPGPRTQKCDRVVQNTCFISEIGAFISEIGFLK